ncbi:MAG: family efflux transporter, subunit [Planctomycetota bacterium]|nr:family efflux transporter, subunit [Planctomycetota bacterium]
MVISTRLPLSRRPVIRGIAIAVVGLAGIVGSLYAWNAIKGGATASSRSGDVPSPLSSTVTLRLTEAQQKAIGLKTSAAEAGTDVEVLEAPGRVTPDESRYAHITSRVAGVVNSVVAQIGQDVKAGDLLATLESPEVATARFDLLTRMQDFEIARTQAEWQAGITSATLELIERLKVGDTPEAIQKRFEGRAVGANREKLLTAESQYRVTRAAMLRNKELLTTNAVSQAQYQVALAEYESALATYQSLIDRMGTETKLANTRAQQDLKQSEIAVRVARGKLRAFGIPREKESIPELPAGGGTAGESASLVRPTMSLYELRAPFDATILDRETIVPGVPIDTSHRIYLLADLATVWIEANVHESNFDMLRASRAGDVIIRSQAFPGRTFPGKVLYTGDLVDEKSRTLKLLAKADNPERLLKPGMFVNVEVRGKAGRPATIIPESALLTSGDSTFVYVRTGPETFEKRAVVPGSRDSDRASLLSGVKPGEEVVTDGAFKLKAEHARLSGGGT